jgi:hypothetical protein
VGEKAAFYVFQVVPELAVSAVLLFTNSRTMFGTPPFEKNTKILKRLRQCWTRKTKAAR